jgi:hypothetical protein
MKKYLKTQNCDKKIESETFKDLVFRFHSTKPISNKEIIDLSKKKKPNKK